MHFPQHPVIFRLGSVIIVRIPEVISGKTNYKRSGRSFPFPSTTLYLRVSHFFQTKRPTSGFFDLSHRPMSSVLHWIGPVWLDSIIVPGEGIIARTGTALHRGMSLSQPGSFNLGLCCSACAWTHISSSNKIQRNYKGTKSNCVRGQLERGKQIQERTKKTNCYFWRAWSKKQDVGSKSTQYFHVPPASTPPKGWANHLSRPFGGTHPRPASTLTP